VARRIAPRSTQGVLLRVVREVLDPQWSLGPAARALAEHVGSDLEPLRAARVHLLAATLDRATLTQAKALATLNVAILEIEARARAVRDNSAQAG
jgi:hypothetical protein